MRKEKLQELAWNALTYCRLQGDVYAVEAVLAEKTVAVCKEEKTEETNFLKKLWGKVTAEFKKESNRAETREITVDRKKAVDALAEFEASCSKKVMRLVEKPEKLQKLLDKKLFKKDRYGLKRMQFALAMAIGDTRGYQRPEESLEVASEILFNNPKKWGEAVGRYALNCEKLRKKLKEEENRELETGLLVGLGVLSLITLSPIAIGVTGLGTAVHLVKRGNTAAAELTVSEQTAFLAMKLTLLEEGRTVMDEEAFKAAVDEFLKRLGDFRADAEYGWLVEKMDAPSCIAKIETCDLCVARLAEILGV